MEGSGQQESTSFERPALRQRAPTITIDTSAVSFPQDFTFSHQEPPSPSNSSSSDQRQRSMSIENRPLLSFSSRPTSPYSTLLPDSRRDDKLQEPPSLLSVPDNRSRGNSLDHSVSSYGGETLLPTPTPSAYGGSRAESSEAIFFHKLGNDDPLKAAPGEEGKFYVEDNPFAFSPGQLSKLFNSQSLAAFCALGGLQGLVLGLRTDRSSGLGLDETTLEGTVGFDQVSATKVPTFLPGKTPSRGGHVRSRSSLSVRYADTERYVDRKRVFGTSRLPEKKSKTIFQIMWETFNDKVLIILTVVAAISLGLGLYQDFGQSGRYGGPKVRWVEGVTIMVAVIIVVMVGSLNDYQKEQQFINLNKKKEDRFIKVIRSGRSMQISIWDILAGDVVHLEPGDLIPADGVFISGHNLRCDESSVTGESDQKKKISGDEVMARIEAGANADELDPFIISGGKVLEGTGTFLVTAVGTNSCYGKLIVTMTNDHTTQPTPLQIKLGVMAEQITKVGCASALLLFIVLFIKFLARLSTNLDAPAQKAQDFLQMVIVAITVIVIAVPEGLPLAVTLALAFAMTRMLKDHNLVRVLSSCETMGNATAICSDKTGTLTTNKMMVVAGILGTNCQFGAQEETILQNPDHGDQAASSDSRVALLSEIASLLSMEVRQVLLQSIAINSTAFDGEEDGQRIFIGSKTETALLIFAMERLRMGSVNDERQNTKVIEVFPFNSDRKCMATVVRLSDGTYRMYVKGASEILLDKCTQMIADVSKPMGDNLTELTRDSRQLLVATIDKYALKSLRTIGIVYRDFEIWPPQLEAAARADDDTQEAVFEDFFEEMVFLSLVGIQDPLRPGVKEAVAQCQHAGVFVRMVTGDNVGTAKAIAEECGILTEGGAVMEGSQFRKLSDTQMDQILPRLQVLARSTPEDKTIIVQRLKALGETVAVTGDGTNDGPALRAADVGFSMGISGTEVAKEASSIILIDDNFSSIVKALEWGRAVNDSVRKFLQFQLTVNITAVGVTFVSAITNINEEPILTPVQLLWVNLIMDTFAALALATDPPTPTVLDRKPDPKSARLITLNMWKMIIGQSIYQLIVTLVLNFSGNQLLGYKTEFEKGRLETLIFNIYVWMQIFNQLNNRRLDNKYNIFEGIHRNLFFVGINLITIGGQVLIIFFGGSALSAVRLDATQWAISIIFGAISLPVAVIIRLIPDDFIRRFIPSSLNRTETTRTGTYGDEHLEWGGAVRDVHDQLTFFKNLRSGRWNSLMTGMQAPGEPRFHSGHNVASGTPNRELENGDPGPSRQSRSRPRSKSALGPAAVMAGVVAGSIGGWPSIESRTEVP